MGKVKDLAGRRFGRLVAIEFAGLSREKSGKLRAQWKFKCDCGNEVVKLGTTVAVGNISSCGCLKKEKLVERTKQRAKGTKQHPLYATWNSMLCRCKYPGTHGYESYGGRGVKVCERWLDFWNFVDDMGPKQKGETLDRVDPDGDYEPGNCRWATLKEQGRNKRTNKIVHAFGEEACIAEWSERYGINKNVINHRLSRGWRPEHAVSWAEERTAYKYRLRRLEAR